MIYTATQIISMVRTAMGRNHMPQPLIGATDPDMVSIDSRIAARIEQTAREVYADTPPALLASDAKSFHNQGVYWHPPKGNLHSGHVLLPDDFMQLVVFEMSDWDRPVFEALNGDSPQYAVTRSRFPGICGCSHKPIAAIVNMPEGRAIEFYSCQSTDAHISAASYIAMPAFDTNGGIDIAANCISAVVSRLATMT